MRPWPSIFTHCINLEFDFMFFLVKTTVLTTFSIILVQCANITSYRKSKHNSEATFVIFVSIMRLLLTQMILFATQIAPDLIIICYRTLSGIVIKINSVIKLEEYPPWTECDSVQQRCSLSLGQQSTSLSPT